MFRQHPGLALVATLALALGVGATTSMFSIVHGGLRPLPFEEAHEIVALTQSAPRSGGTAADLGLQPDDYRAWAAGLTTLESVGGFEMRAMNIADDGMDPERVDAVAVTSSAFPITGVQAALGRVLQPADEKAGAPPVVVLSSRLWGRRYGGDPSVLGRTIQVDDEPYQVVGIMPDGFEFPIRATFGAGVRVPVRDGDIREGRCGAACGGVPD